jgi:hypothetical protein
MGRCLSDPEPYLVAAKQKKNHPHNRIRKQSRETIPLKRVQFVYQKIRTYFDADFKTKNLFIKQNSHKRF